jgi:hypothetical protein
MTEDETTARLHEMMPLCATLGVRAEKYTADAVSLSLDWSPALCTTNGLIYGGVIMALADSAGGACALLNYPRTPSGLRPSSQRPTSSRRHGWHCDRRRGAAASRRNHDRCRDLGA